MAQGVTTPVHGGVANFDQQQQLEAELERVQAHAEQLATDRYQIAI
jgi:hypothetical protein